MDFPMWGVLSLRGPQAQGRQDIRDTKFSAWAGQNGIGLSNNPSEPHCVTIDGHNKGLRDWWCVKKLAYICELTPSKVVS
ncbi:hypothetical protein EVAR_15845_1 [Eumeta japonica]|uniref:C-type lectin domain-containing protein n=1 Tax=Eumeta variegata TaxID=151549 RepID=A0A4C1UE80_EUMVA|nr:hypothetical protein EVAR_15845_1 [Eumeta japonica]